MIPIKKKVGKSSPNDDKKMQLKNPVKALSKQQISECLNAIFQLTKQELESKKSLFASDSSPIFMQITCIKMNKMPSRKLRIPLPHTIVSSDDDVALFVCDLERGRRRDFEPTIDHYRDLLDEHHCKNIKDIIPMNQVKTEYDQFELKRKLFASYDRFLVDGRIAGHMTHLLGKHFDHYSKSPTPIKMNSKNLKQEIDCALRKTVIKLNAYSNNHIVQIGHTQMKKRQILENILAACLYLCQHYPGGWANIRSIYLKSRSTVAIPFYMTLKIKNEVPMLLIKPKRPKAYKVVEGELTTMPGHTVSLTPEGETTLTKISSDEEC